MRLGVYPGSFDPPTSAHLAVIEAALAQRSLDRLDLAISRRALAKSTPAVASPDERAAVLAESVIHLGRVAVRITDDRLISDIAAGYDVVVMGADKFHQIRRLEFYGGSLPERDRALASLPEIAVAPRPPHEVPPELLLVIDPGHRTTSSTRARRGERHLMTPAARAYAARTGAWGGAR